MSVEPMPVAKAPNAPYVHVCESPPTISSPGATRPSSGSTTCSMPPRPTSKKCSMPLLDREVFHQLRELCRLRVLRRNEMVGDQRDLARIEDALRAFDLAHHPDCDGRGELVGQNEVDLGVDDLPRLDALADPRGARESSRLSVMPMITSIIRRSKARNLPMMQHEREFGFSTRALHAGTPPDPATGSRAAPIYQTAAYVFGSTEQAAELFALRSYGHIYSRISNPTVAAFEERMASLEGGLGAIAFSSGLAAQLCTVLSLAQSRRSSRLHAKRLRRHGHAAQRDGQTDGDRNDLRRRPRISTPCAPRSARTRSCSSSRRSAIRRASLPTCARFAELAHDAGIPLVVDNTFATPYLCRPIEHGADIVVHSATKFINGHGTAIGGVLVESGKFPWDNGRFPLLSTPSPGYHQKVFTETFGEYAFLMRARAEVLRDVGAQMSPMDAWLAPARAGDARGAHGASRQQRARGRGFLEDAPRGRVGSRAAARIDLHVRAARRPRRRRGASSTRSSCGAISPTSATRRASSFTPPRRRIRSFRTTSCARPASSPRRCVSPSVSKTSTI